jgi:uncharacterized 2Fe-2S/4Fe-4S cluster protein (DUF4445 family)
MKSVLSVLSASGQLRIEFDPPKRLYDLLSDNGVEIDAPCGGRRRCLKCKVRATGDLGPMGGGERSLLTPDEIKNNIRYACMTELTGDAQVELVDRKNRQSSIMTDMNLPDFTLSPWNTSNGGRYGIAVDIGTTTVAAYLYRLSDGQLCNTLAQNNPQAVFGADVISRLEKSLKGRSAELAASIRGCLSDMINEICRQYDIPTEAVGSIVMTGNTAMLYLLTGRNPESITAAPFEQDCYFGMSLKAGELDLPFKAEVYLPRCISAYVGADITTALLSAEFVRGGKVVDGAPRLLVDIGTNGEMALAANGRLLCCSTAAGPAFEGAGIRYGMPAKTGAIYKVEVINGEIISSALGGQAEGICGSGLVDAVAAMCRTGILDETGLINDSGHDYTEYIVESDGMPAFRLPGTDVLITQKDVRAVQLAKSAICAGMRTLIKVSGYRPDEIEQLVIAGGFGSHINVESAEKIGLIPEGFARKALAIGNAAGAGAAMVLLSRDIREQSEKIGELTQTVELSTSEDFMEAYINGMMF